MGDPKKKHKRYTTPKRPYDFANLEEELKLVGAYSLRNKRELWSHRTKLSTLRRRARQMLSMDPTDRANTEKEMIRKLSRVGMVDERASLDDILGLTIQDLMERRLQTIVFRKRMAKSLHQARQLITHGHIAISGQKVKAPSYTVSSEDEANLDYAASSPLAVKTHPMRQELLPAEAAGGEPVE